VTASVRRSARGEISLSASDNSQRVPPRNVEAERNVLGAILLMGVSDHSDSTAEALFAEQSTTIAVAQTFLRVEDFYSDTHARIFACMIELNQRKVTVDATTLSDMLRSKNLLETVGGPAYIADLAASVPTAENIAHYARIVREKAALRLVISVATDIASRAYDSPLDVGEFLADAEARVTSITRLDIDAAEPPLCDAIGDVVRSVGLGELAGVPSGFSKLDKELATGGLARGDLCVVAAGTSVGKTALAGNIAVRIPRGGALYFTIEMNRLDMIRRMIADLGHVDWARIARRRPALPDADEAAQIKHGAERLGDLAIDILYRRELTPLIVRREVRLALQKFDGKLDLIVVDYLQLMDADPDERRRRDRRDLEIGSITKALKSIASEFRVPVLLLSQLNRDAAKTEGSEPELWHLRDSGAIEQDADVVIFLWRPRDKRDSNLIDWKIAKQRNGKVVRLDSLHFEPEFTRFYEKH